MIYTFHATCFVLSTKSCNHTKSENQIKIIIHITSKHLYHNMKMTYTGRNMSYYEIICYTITFTYNNKECSTCNRPAVSTVAVQAAGFKWNTLYSTIKCCADKNHFWHWDLVCPVKAAIGNLIWNYIGLLQFSLTPHSFPHCRTASRNP